MGPQPRQAEEKQGEAQHVMSRDEMGGTQKRGASCRDVQGGGLPVRE